MTRQGMGLMTSNGGLATGDRRRCADSCAKETEIYLWPLVVLGARLGFIGKTKGAQKRDFYLRSNSPRMDTLAVDCTPDV